MADVPSLGPRGEGWVWIQLALLLAVLVVSILGPRWPGAVQGVLAAAGALLALAGAAVGYATARALGRGLRPHPKPGRDAELVTHGPYAVVRHPFYAGALLFLAGLSLAFSPLGLALTAVLALVFALKAAVEERFLREAFPEYAAYALRVRRRLVPFVY